MPFSRAENPGTRLLSKPAGCPSRALYRSLVAGTLSRYSWGGHVPARSFRLGLLLLSLRRRSRRLLLPAADCGNGLVSWESHLNPSYKYSFCMLSRISAQQTALMSWPCLFVSAQSTPGQMLRKRMELGEFPGLARLPLGMV